MLVGTKITLSDGSTGTVQEVEYDRFLQDYYYGVVLENGEKKLVAESEVKRFGTGYSITVSDGGDHIEVEVAKDGKVVDRLFHDANCVNFEQFLREAILAMTEVNILI